MLVHRAIQIYLALGALTGTTGLNSAGRPRNPLNRSKVTWQTWRTLLGEPISIPQRCFLSQLQVISDFLKMANSKARNEWWSPFRLCWSLPVSFVSLPMAPANSFVCVTHGDGGGGEGAVSELGGDGRRRISVIFLHRGSEVVEERSANESCAYTITEEGWRTDWRRCSASFSVLWEMMGGNSLTDPVEEAGTAELVNYSSIGKKNQKSERFTNFTHTSHSLGYQTPLKLRYLRPCLVRKDTEYCSKKEIIF